MDKSSLLLSFKKEGLSFLHLRARSSFLKKRSKKLLSVWGAQPAFWRFGGSGGWVLWPASVVVAGVTRRRVARAGWRAPVPVICCGNAGVGGAGKTTLVLDLAQRLRARGVSVHLLTRGHGGSLRGPVRVDPALHGAADVGDEALLLAACAPTWCGGDRAVTARLAVAAGAGALIMDDGLQNPTLEKTASLLVIDGAAGFGNGRVLPAGPLREPVQAACARAAAAVLIGDDTTSARGKLPAGLPVLCARLEPGPEAALLAGKRVVAFAAIGRPEKFFAMLAQSGIELAARLPFPDHHVYGIGELAALRRQAKDLHAVPVTTPKDAARIGAELSEGITAIGVSLRWADEAALERLLDQVLGMQAAP